MLLNIVTEYQGKVHDSQSHVHNGSYIISLVIYYEVPEDKRDEVKQIY